MKWRNRILASVAGAAGLAAAAGAVQVARRRQVIGRRVLDDTPFGSLRSEPVTVVADDGVPLCVEIDEVGPPELGRRRKESEPEPLTVVFCHGYTLNKHSWHFQRAAYRGLVRSVFYDQRSHGRSGRSEVGNATIEQLGQDLAEVIEHVAPGGPVVLVGHSMGGMTIVALAEQHPEWFGDRIVGVGLVATTAGGLDPAKLLMPLVPSKVGGPMSSRTVRTLARGHKAVDGVRRIGRAIAVVATDTLAFGDSVPKSYVDFVDEMIRQTPFEVIAEFYPSFHGLDKFHAVECLSKVPTVIICGTKDRLTSLGHSRKLHSRIAGAELYEMEGAGHMVMLERYREVNEALDGLLNAAADYADGLR